MKINLETGHNTPCHVTHWGGHMLGWGPMATHTHMSLWGYWVNTGGANYIYHQGRQMRGGWGAGCSAGVWGGRCVVGHAIYSSKIWESNLNVKTLHMGSY